MGDRTKMPVNKRKQKMQKVLRQKKIEKKQIEI